MRTLGLLLSLLLAIAVARPAYGDGKVFPPVAAPADVPIPNQRALISWSNGVERLTIETRFLGSASEFAWVVPLPSAPKIDPMDPGLFVTLTRLLRPTVVHQVWMWGCFVAGGLGVLWFVLKVRARTPLHPVDFLAALAIGSVLIPLNRPEISAVLAVGVGGMGVRVRRSGALASEWIVVVGIIAVFAGMLLPSLAKANAGGSGVETGVDVIQTQLAGIFETTTLRGRDAGAVRRWLEAHGFAMPAGVESVLGDYVQDGWVFVASRVRGGVGDTRVQSIHPLRFTFESAQPIYPMRLTGVGHGKEPLEVELFVVGPGRAEAEGFEVRDCRPTSWASGSDAGMRIYVPRDTLPLVHEGLRDSAAGEFSTRLYGRLGAEQMKRDVVLRWNGATPARDVRYSRAGAAKTALNAIVAGVSLVAMAGLVAGHLGWAAGRGWLRRVVFGAGVWGVAVGMWWVATPTLPVRLQKRGALGEWANAKSAFLEARIALADGLDTNRPVTLESVREVLARAKGSEGVNGATVKDPGRKGLELKEEESPWNYSLRAVRDGVELRFHDGWGGVFETVRLPER